MFPSARNRSLVSFVLVLCTVLAAQAQNPLQFPVERFLNMRSATSPTLSPQGNEVAFLTNITGVPQVWKIALTGGWPDQLTFFRDRVARLEWSPRGDWIAFSLDLGGNERWQIHLVSPDGATVRQLTNEPKVIHNFGAWSPDGPRIAYGSNARDERYFDIYLLDVATGQSRRVYEANARLSAEAFSPDGRLLVLHRANTNLDGDLLLLDLSTGQATHLTPHTGEADYSTVTWLPDGSGFYLLSDEGRDFTNLGFFDIKKRKLAFRENESWDAEAVAVSADGRRLAMAVNVDGYSELRVKDGSGPWKKISLRPPGVIGSGVESGQRLIFTRDGQRLVFSLAASRSTADVLSLDLSTNRTAQTTRSAMAGMPRDVLVEPELLHYPTFDGRQIPAFLYRPHGREKNLPVVIWIHGGPESQYRPTLNSVIQYFVTRGFAVLAPNVRGSTGYGKAYSHLDDVARRPDAVQDVAEAARWLGSSGIAAPDKIAVMGGSYGGYMTLAALTSHPDIWAAGVDLYGIANFKSFFQNTGPWRVELREAEYGSLEHDATLLEKISPLTHVDKIRAPLLVIAGANDPRVPREEAEQIVAAVKKQGGQVEYLLFPDEGHGVVKLANRIKAYSAIADFLDKHLTGLVD